MLSNRSLSQLSVDSPEDFRNLELTAHAMTRPQWEYGFREIIALREQVRSYGMVNQC